MSSPWQNPVEVTGKRKEVIEHVVMAGCSSLLDALCERTNTAPTPAACMIADVMIYSIADIDAEAAVDYFRAVLDSIRHADDAAAKQAATDRRWAAFERLCRSAQLGAAKPDGRA